MHNPLPNHAREIVFGSLFGDGGVYLSNGSRHAHYMECHSLKEHEYILWKSKVLMPLITNGITKQTHFHKKRGKFYTTLTIRTKNHSYFTRLRKYFYKNGKKIVRRKLLNKLTPVGLAVWFMDDGGSQTNNRGYHQIKINTCSFSKEEHQVFVEYFKENLDIDIRIHRNGEYYHIYMNKPNAKKFVSIIKPYVLPCMRYKIFNFLQNNPIRYIGGRYSLN